VQGLKKAYWWDKRDRWQLTPPGGQAHGGDDHQKGIHRGGKDADDTDYEQKIRHVLQPTLNSKGQKKPSSLLS
jgi:hypothetical protein